MKFFKKSLGQNFLIEKNIIKKIVISINLKNKNILEIGPGKGALTDEIIKKNPKTLFLIEKDFELVKYLNKKYISNKNVKIINSDILKINLKKFLKKEVSILGNLPYNISSQIFIKILKDEQINKNKKNLVLMFQKELGEKIIAKYPSKNYGRLSIIANFKLRVLDKFLVSNNCFFPKPKITSIVIHFKTYKNKKFYIKNMSNLEKITNVLFSNKRKMINKSIKKILNEYDLKKLPELKLNLRAENIEPNIFYKITEIYEANKDQH